MVVAGYYKIQQVQRSRDPRNDATITDINSQHTQKSHDSHIIRRRNELLKIQINKQNQQHNYTLKITPPSIPNKQYCILLV
jgi:hypothetical protein